MICADALSRIVIPNSEMPIGILISMIGAPVFIYLMVKDLMDLEVLSSEYMCDRYKNGNRK